MKTWRRYKDVLCHPGSELEKHLAAGDAKKAEDVYKKITDEGYARGEFKKRLTVGDVRFLTPVPVDITIDVTVTTIHKKEK